jgi:hypothetical protein
LYTDHRSIMFLKELLSFLLGDVTLLVLQVSILGVLQTKKKECLSLSLFFWKNSKGLKSRNLEERKILIANNQ